MNPEDEGSSSKRRLQDIPDELLGIISATLADDRALKRTNSTMQAIIEKSDSYWNKRILQEFGEEFTKPEKIYKTLKAFHDNKLTFTYDWYLDDIDKDADAFVGFYVSIHYSTKFANGTITITGPFNYIGQFEMFAQCILDNKDAIVRIGAGNVRQGDPSASFQTHADKLQIILFTDDDHIDDMQVSMPIQRQAFAQMFTDLAEFLKSEMTSKVTTTIKDVL